MNPVEGGDTYLEPMNMRPLGTAAMAPVESIPMMDDDQEEAP
jgi:hypothetical protein